MPSESTVKTSEADASHPLAADGNVDLTPPSLQRISLPAEGEGDASNDLPPEEPPLRVMSLHALLYCERLFYLEEVEEIRVADFAVYAGRRLHEELSPLDDESPDRRRCEVASETWGVYGVVDAVRRRDGAWVAYEHKRGRCRRGADKEVLAWPSDRIQAIAYAVLLEESLSEPAPQARIRYHADNVTAFIDVDDDARADLRKAIDRARDLRRATVRPPVTENENLCKRCSLAPVCLPEEERLAPSGFHETRTTSIHDPATEEAVSHIEATAACNERIGGASVEKPAASPARQAPTLFPSNRERQTLHVMSPRAYVSRSGESLVVTVEDEKQRVPIEEVDAVVIHGYGQVTTQAIHLCSHRGVSIEWMTGGGKFAAGTTASSGRVQQRIRQYAALGQPEVRLELTRRLVEAKVETELKYVLRATRGNAIARDACRSHIAMIRETLRKIARAASQETLRGLEGMAAKSYFACFGSLLARQVAEDLRPQGRTKHPPRDRFNALLSFGYALIQTLVHRNLVAVGIEPAFGFFHQPRTAAHPLVLDLMELFRTPLWDMPVIGSVNRGQWDADADFTLSPGQVWLSESGRKKAVALFEQRLQESYKHPHTGQSLCYARMVELEARLLEKEWSGCPGLFARWRMR